MAFAVQHDFRAQWRASTADILDLGIPALHNITAQEVRVTKVTIVDRPTDFRILRTDAYNYRQSGGGVISEIGDLPHDCPKYDPHPVRAAVTAANSDSAWFIVIAFQVSRPGTYHIAQLRIDYEDTAGHAWQYQNVDTTLFIHAATHREMQHRRRTPCQRAPAP